MAMADTLKAENDIRFSSCHVPAGLPQCPGTAFISEALWLVLRPCDYFLPKLYNSKFQTKPYTLRMLLALAKCVLEAGVLSSVPRALEHLLQPSRGGSRCSVN